MTRKRKCRLSASHNRIPLNKQNLLLNHSSLRRKEVLPVKAMSRAKRLRISLSTWLLKSMTARKLTLMRRKTRFMWVPHRHNSRRHKLHSNSRRVVRQVAERNQLPCRRNSKTTTMKKRTKMEVRRYQEHTIQLNTQDCRCQARSRNCLNIFNVISLRR